MLKYEIRNKTRLNKLKFKQYKIKITINLNKK